MLLVRLCRRLPVQLPARRVPSPYPFLQTPPPEISSWWALTSPAPPFRPSLDSQNNTFIEVGNQLTSPGDAFSRVYYAKNIKGGADTVIVNLAGSSPWIEMYLTEYSGIDQTNPIDAQASASGSAGAVSSGNATTTAAGDIIYAYCLADWACTAGSGFTARSTLDANLIEDRTAGNPGSYAATGTANNGWSMQMVALKPASSGVGSPPVITSAGTASGTVGSAFSYQITATNTPTSYGATGLPAGLSVNTATGVISGTPTGAGGTSSVTLSATNSAGTGNATLTLTITAVPVITSATSASGTVGSAFSYSITATNTPTSYGATGLPTGLSVNTGTGVISGTPTGTGGTSTVTLSATNAVGTGNATLTLTITAVPVITSATSASGTVGSAFSYSITATNTPTSYGATGLPTGLSVNTGTGVISGTPTGTGGTSTVTLSATNSAGTGTATLTLTITAVPVITSATSASGTVGSAFSYSITATNTPTSYGATGLPTGLSVNTANGRDLGHTHGGGRHIVGDVERDQQRWDRQRDSDADHHGCAGDHQRHERQRHSRKRLLIFDHGHQHTHQLRSHRVAHRLIDQHWNGRDLGHTDGNGRHIVGDAERDQQRWDRQRDSDADHHGCAGDHQRHERQRHSRKRLLVFDHCHQHTHQLWSHRVAHRLIDQHWNGRDLGHTDGNGRHIDGDAERHQ